MKLVTDKQHRFGQQIHVIGKEILFDGSGVASIEEGLFGEEELADLPAYDITVIKDTDINSVSTDDIRKQLDKKSFEELTTLAAELGIDEEQCKSAKSKKALSELIISSMDKS